MLYEFPQHSCVQKDIFIILSIVLHLVQGSMICICIDISHYSVMTNIAFTLDDDNIPEAFCGVSVT
jgi:hypothetical protein